MRAVIIIRGGVMQAAYSDNPSLDIDLIDHDNLEAEGVDDAEEVEREAIEGMTAVY